jgi:hypothetical protein
MVIIQEYFLCDFALVLLYYTLIPSPDIACDLRNRIRPSRDENAASYASILWLVKTYSSRPAKSVYYI